MKLIHHDDKEYILEHPSGKKITVAKKGLTPEAHSIIQQFADGGTAEEDPGEEASVMTGKNPDAGPKEGDTVAVPGVAAMAKEEPEDEGDEEAAPQAAPLPDNIKPAIPGAPAGPAATTGQPSNPFEEKAQSMQSLLAEGSKQAGQYAANVAAPAQQYDAAAATVGKQMQDLQQQAQQLQMQRKAADDKF